MSGPQTENVCIYARTRSWDTSPRPTNEYEKIGGSPSKFGRKLAAWHFQGFFINTRIFFLRQDINKARENIKEGSQPPN